MGPAQSFHADLPEGHGGGGPPVQAVLGDVSQLTLLGFAASNDQIAAGRIKPLAVTSARRLPELPDVPTVAESSFSGFKAHSWIFSVEPGGRDRRAGREPAAWSRHWRSRLGPGVAVGAAMGAEW